MVLGKRRLSTLVGWLIIFGHFGLIALILTYLDTYLNANQKMQVILTLSPVTTTYLIAVAKNFIARQQDFGPGPRVNANFFVLAVIFPMALICFLYYLILRYPSSIAGDVNSLQTWTAAAEVALGGVVGLIIEDLFPRAHLDPPGDTA